MSRFACSLALVVSFAASPAFAQDGSAPPDQQTIVAAARTQAAALNTSVQPPLMKTEIVREQKRPAAMIPMYAGFATLQGLDYHTTTRALSTGAGREANPMMGKVVGNKAAFIGLKAASTAGVIVIGEKLWKKNRAGAIVFMAVANGVMASVVAHNYSVMR